MTTRLRGSPKKGEAPVVAHRGDAGEVACRSDLTPSLAPQRNPQHTNLTLDARNGLVLAGTTMLRPLGGRLPRPHRSGARKIRRALARQARKGVR